MISKMLLTCSLLLFTYRVHGTVQDRIPVKRNAFDDYQHHEIIIPRVYNQEDALIETTKLEDTSHLKNITIKFTAFQNSFAISLHLNHNLFTSGYIEKTLRKNKEDLHEIKVEKHCYYSGQVIGQAHSTAAISTCDGIRGYVTTGDEGYHIEPLESALSSDHLIFRDSDYIDRNLSCGHGYEIFPRTKTLKERPSAAHRMRRRSLHWPYDANDKTLLVELYVANDFTQYVTMDRDSEKVIRRTKDIVNIVSSLYRPLNIYISLVGVEVWADGDKIQIVENADKTMNNFLDYRRHYISPKYHNDNAQLILGHRLGEGVVGKAPIMTICTWQYSGGVNLDHSALVGPVATTVAHEMGHNFGLTHDTETCGCPDNRCIMAPSSGGQKNPTKWSVCSKQQFDDAFNQGMDYCLHNTPTKLYNDAICGNGFVEDGEQCDCGLPQDCNNNCCDAESCLLLPNATCATGECCDKQTCKYKRIAMECRPSHGVCDLAEYCDGASEFCPSDVHVQDGTVCSTSAHDESYCYKGGCRSQDSQCQLLWGKTGKASHRSCFDQNSGGSVSGHCGFNWIDGKSFAKCEDRDVMCGMLHCQHRNEKLMFWKEALAYTLPEGFVMVNNARQDCKGVILDVGLDMPDPGMVPDGAKCGSQKLCINQKCRDIGDVVVERCPNCNGHGVCNSLQQCHCDAGFAPPFCDQAGHGGSKHSGPIMIEQSNIDLIIGLSVIIFLVLPLVVFLIFCGYRHRKKIKQAWWIHFGDKYSFAGLPALLDYLFDSGYFSEEWLIYLLFHCKSVHQSNPFNDSERQPDMLQPSVINDASVAVVDEEPAHHRSVGHKLKPPARPSSVVIRSNAPIYRRVDVRRTLSFTPHDISTPKLLSSTNLNLDQLLPVSTLSMIHPNGSIANGGSTAHLHVQTLPHPAKKSVLHDTIAENDVFDDCPKRAEETEMVLEDWRLPWSGEHPYGNINIECDENVYEEIAAIPLAPTEPPPAPPDSRYRFYSLQPGSANAGQVASPASANSGRAANSVNANFGRVANPTSANSSRVPGSTNANSGRISGSTVANSGRVANPTSANLSRAVSSPANANSSRVGNPISVNPGRVASPANANSGRVAGPANANLSRVGNRISANSAHVASPANANSGRIANSAGANSGRVVSPSGRSKDKTLLDSTTKNNVGKPPAPTENSNKSRTVARELQHETKHRPRKSTHDLGRTPISKTTSDPAANSSKPSETLANGTSMTGRSSLSAAHRIEPSVIAENGNEPTAVKPKRRHTKAADGLPSSRHASRTSSKSSSRTGSESAC